MKIKTSFVTNSSSVSFCGWGIEFRGSFEKLPEKIQEMVYQEFIKHDHSDGVSFEEFKADAEEWYWEDYLDDVFEKFKLDVRVRSDDDMIYISLHPNNAPKDKTIDEIISEIQKTINDLGFNQKVTFISTSWYNG